jgi:hypothetical protein
VHLQPLGHLSVSQCQALTRPTLLFNSPNVSKTSPRGFSADHLATYQNGQSGAKMNCRVARENRRTFVSVMSFDLFSRRNQAGTRIFSIHIVPRLCVTIGHQVNEFQASDHPEFSLNLPIRTHSNKWFCPGSGTRRAQPTAEEARLKGSALILPPALADINIHKSRSVYL